MFFTSTKFFVSITPNVGYPFTLFTQNVFLPFFFLLGKIFDASNQVGKKKKKGKKKEKKQGKKEVKQSTLSMENAEEPSKRNHS